MLIYVILKYILLFVCILRENMVSRSKHIEKKPPKDTIWFSHKNGEHGIFSNYYPASFEVKGVKYPTAEHYFQSMKFVGSADEYAEQIRLAKTPEDASRMGKSKEHKMRDDWEYVKFDIMGDAISYKFTQNVTTALTNTCNKILVFHTPDTYWGDGNDEDWAKNSDYDLDGTKKNPKQSIAKGQNKLGIALMQFREWLFHGGNRNLEYGAWGPIGEIV